MSARPEPRAPTGVMPELRALTGARPELRALTGARGVAAWLVVLYHIRLSIAGLPPGWERLFAKGYLAVDFFFLLSGFVIWLTWSDRLRHGGVSMAATFLRRRVARIWPLHLVMLGAAVAMAALLAATGRHDPARFPVAELPLHLLLLQNWGFTDRLSWNDPAWSISCEWAAYLLFPLWARAIDWRRWPAWAVVMAAAALLLLLAAAMGGERSLGADIPRFGLVRCLAEFAAGGAVCALWQRWSACARPAALAALGVAATLIAGWRLGVPEPLAVPGAFAAALLALALTSGLRANPLAWAPVHYVGEISYATYLSHFLLFFAFKLAFVRDAAAVPPAQVALYLAMVLACSIALYHLVEQPAQWWINALPSPGRRARAVRAGQALGRKGAATVEKTK